MIRKERKWIFRTLEIVLDDEAAKSYAVKKTKYSRVVVFSRSILNLPGFYRMEKPTAVIDLSAKEEDVFSRFTYENRHKIRKSEQDADMKTVVDDNNFGAAYDLYLRFQKARGAKTYGRDFFKQSRLFACYIKGEMISAIFVDEGAQHLYVRFIFSKRLETSDKDMYRRINMASRRLVWEVCKWGKRNGFLSLDLAGVNFKEPEKAGITEFKMSFGSVVANEYTYVWKSRFFSFIEKLAGMRTLLRV